MKCYASDYCQKDKSSCSDVCGGYRVLRALYNLSRIPERYRYTIALKPENGEDLEAFTTLDNYKNDVLSMVDEGRGLYIWGKSTGNGKTSSNKADVIVCDELLADRKNGDFDTLAVLSIQRSNGEKVEVNRYFKEGEKSFIEISPEEYEERKKMHEKRQEQEAKAQDEN